MQVIRHLDASLARFESAVATLGNFDGVHVGHQEILSRVVRQAAERRGKGIAITFFPHPAAVLAPERAPALLMTLRERLVRICDAGIDAVVLWHFTPAFAARDAAEFVETELVRRLGVAKMIVGHNVNFGRGRGGNAATLAEAGRRFGFEVEVVGPVTADGIAVSSSEVRKCLSAGDLSLATRLLGRAYSVESRVIVGDRRGRAFGFPTANLRPRAPIFVPDGVYAVRMDWKTGHRGGVANIGRKPTFGQGHLRTLEAHLFDFDGDLYGERLRVSFVERLRGETRFPSPQALVEQIRKDAERAREVLQT
jgi:riboflavin kinase/FMN adenylyltransferase